MPLTKTAAEFLKNDEPTIRITELITVSKLIAGSIYSRYGTKFYK
jgi:hypothetical protein